jgi:hypothetical protein
MSSVMGHLNSAGIASISYRGCDEIDLGWGGLRMAYIK